MWKVERGGLLSYRGKSKVEEVKIFNFNGRIVIVWG